ncbi:HIT family protein [Psychrobacter sp. 72-O-c]|uniref:HIT family protein n=1 Tax=Psychrobacter sp. 72-O-c TaxID=2774125 RepID=UPI001918131D|nr:HIT family protein [Psychrobacter sp. 72-O-c]
MSQNNQQTTYDDNNIFAKMLKGEIPYHKVYEDDKTLAFMDIMPQAEGHVLVIPKQKAVDLGELEPEYAAAVLMTAKKIMQAQRQVFEREGIIQMQFNGAQAGQTVFHYHVHLIPASVQELGMHAAKMADQEKLAETAKQLAAVIATQVTHNTSSI